MKTRTPILALVATCLAIGGLQLASAQAQDRTAAPTVSTGVDYEFRRPIYNGLGIESLSELRGKPLLVEFWSYQCPPCVGSAVPHALRMKEEFGDDFNVLFCEASRAGESQVLSYALNKRWLSAGALWTTERVLRRDKPDVPYFVLLDADGEVALEGIATEHDRKLEEKVQELIKANNRGPREMPRDLAKAILECNAGNFAKARELAQSEIAAAGEDTLKAQEARRVLATVEERLAQNIKRARWMLDNGYPIEAAETLDKLARGVKGWQDPEVRVSEMATELETPEMKRELEAQKALQKVERKLFEDPDVRWVKQLQKIVERYPRTKTAERAKQLAKIASI